MFKESIKKNTAIKVTTMAQINNLCDWLEKEMGQIWSERNREKALASHNIIFPEKDQYFLESAHIGHNVVTISYEEALKEKPMNKKEKALKELEEIRKRTDELERIINEPEIEYYDVETPINYDGDILFNDSKQLLRVIGSVYNIVSVGLGDHRSKFVWVPCKREELKAGDTAYRSNSSTKSFKEFNRVCKILDNSNYVFLEDMNVHRRSLFWNHWYKLVRRDEVEG